MNQEEKMLQLIPNTAKAFSLKYPNRYGLRCLVCKAELTQGAAVFGWRGGPRGGWTMVHESCAPGWTPQPQPPEEGKNQESEIECPTCRTLNFPSKNTAGTIPGYFLYTCSQCHIEYYHPSTAKVTIPKTSPVAVPPIPPKEIIGNPEKCALCGKATLGSIKLEVLAKEAIGADAGLRNMRLPICDECREGWRNLPEWHREIVGGAAIEKAIRQRRDEA